MKGKSIALFIDTFREVQQQQQMYGYGGGPQFLPINTGLDRLLNHYGAQVSSAYLLDESCYEQQVPPQYGGGKRPLYFAPIIKSKYINSRLDFLNNINGLIMLKISPLEIYKDKIATNKIKSTVVFSSTEKGWQTEGAINLHPMYMTPPADDKKASRPLALLLEGNFPSYFAGREIPVKEGADQGAKKGNAPNITGEGDYLTRGKPGKIFIIGTGELLKNNLIDEEGNSPNAMFLMNIIDYLNNKGDYAKMRSKSQKLNPLTDLKPGMKTFVKSFNIAGLPLLVILAGLFIWLKRAARRKELAEKFQKRK